jgi:hypothetical protein
MAIDARIRGDLKRVLLFDPLDSRARPRSGETVRHRPDPAKAADARHLARPR